MRIDHLIELLAKLNKRYIHIRDIASEFGLSRRTAGKIMARLESLGYVDKYSHNVYKFKIINDER